MHKRGGHKTALGTRRPIIMPQAANERWSLDFISDAFTDGCRFRVLDPIGNIPPAEAETNFYAALETEPMAA